MMDVIEKDVLKIKNDKSKAVYYVNSRKQVRALYLMNDFIPITDVGRIKAGLMKLKKLSGIIGLLHNVPIMFNKNRRGIYLGKW